MFVSVCPFTRAKQDKSGGEARAGWLNLMSKRFRMVDRNWPAFLLPVFVMHCKIGRERVLGPGWSLERFDFCCGSAKRVKQAK